MRFLVIMLCLFLGGCFKVTVPVIEKAEAVFPFQEHGSKKAAGIKIRFARPDAFEGFYLAQIIEGWRIKPAMLLSIRGR